MLKENLTEEKQPRAQYEYFSLFTSPFQHLWQTYRKFMILIYKLMRGNLDTIFDLN